MNTSRGQFLVELLVAIGLMLVVLPPLVYVMIASRQSQPLRDVRASADGLMQETFESIRSIRERGWNYISTNGTYHPALQGSVWELSAGSDVRGDFTRSVTISDVYKNLAGAIVSSASGTLDPAMKQVDARISWTAPHVSTIQSRWYLSRYLGNQSRSQTTAADFSSGVFYQTQATTVSGGEISLANNNKGKWCSPALSSTAIDLPDGPPVAVVATASASVSVPNDVFVATAPSTDSSIKMAYVNVAADSETPTAALRGIFTLDSSKYSAPELVPSNIGLTNSFKTNDIKYYKSASGKTYALMTTDLPDREVIAVQVNNGIADAYQDSVNHIYTYWTYFNTRIFGGAYHSPVSNAAVTTSAGDNNGYSNPTNAYTLNNVSAVDTNSGTNTGTSCTGTDKDKHRYYDFGLTVPSSATVNGIEVALVASADSTTGSPKICVQLSWDGGTTWTSALSTSTLATNLAPYVLGGSANTWGRTWSGSDFSNTNFRVRLINVASNTSRDFSLDYIGVKVYYDGISTMPNDQEPFGYGAKALTVLGDRGYVSSGGYLYVFDLSTIDAKSPTNSLDQVGCRIQLNGYDCSPGTGTDRKYASGETGANWSDTTGPAHNDCSDGGNIELYATNHLDGVQVGGSTYIFAAVGAGTNPEFEIVNATSVPDVSSSPSIANASCGRISGGNAAWKSVGSLDFNSDSGTEEAANSVYASSDGTRAYVSSNGGIDGNNDGLPDSKQWYIINTTNKTSPQFLSGSPSTGATSGYYEATTAANLQMYPRRSLTVLNKSRAVLVGKDGVSDANNAQEYQVLNIESEASPQLCGVVNFNEGFNDLTSVSEADGDNYVYMVANTTEKQLKIIEGGPDTGLYLATGTFESPVIDTGSSAMLNRFVATVNQPAQTTIKMQVAYASPGGGSCAGAAYQYVGPDGLSSSYFTPQGASISASFPLGTYGGYANPNQCFRYKVFLDTTDTNASPIFLDMGINYSP